MTVVDQAVAVMEQAKREIFSLRASNADLRIALKFAVENCEVSAAMEQYFREVIARSEPNAPGIHKSSIEAYPHILNTSAAPVPEVSE